MTHLREWNDKTDMVGRRWCVEGALHLRRGGPTGRRIDARARSSAGSLLNDIGAKPLKRIAAAGRDPAQDAG